MCWTPRLRTAILLTYAIARIYTGGFYLLILVLLRQDQVILALTVILILFQAVILSHRPPISLARTSVSAALLEELLGEISSLASVYHKPPETFIGKGRFGADAMQKISEYVSKLLNYLMQFFADFSNRKGQDEDASRLKAIETVFAGQNAENLLDFDDAPADDGQPTGLAATQFTSTPAAASLIAGTSSNPLDDLVSIFGGANLGGDGMASGAGAANGLDFLSSPTQNTPKTNGGLAGMMSPVATVSSPQPSQSNSQGQQEDLLGLF